MKLEFESISEDRIELCRDLCNELMDYQQSVARIHPEWFDPMSFDTRLLPSVRKAASNYTVVLKADGQPVGYVYANISAKETYSNDFATFFDLASVERSHVGCLSQFYLKANYRQSGAGSTLFRMAIDWLKGFDDVDDYFVFVSNGNENALEFYQRRGFAVSHDILDGFITVLRMKRDTA